jgi:hypothetical protein
MCTVLLPPSLNPTAVKKIKNKIIIIIIIIIIIHGDGSLKWQLDFLREPHFRGQLR